MWTKPRVEQEGGKGREKSGSFRERGRALERVEVETEESACASEFVSVCVRAWKARVQSEAGTFGGGRGRESREIERERAREDDREKVVGEKGG